MSTSTPHTSVVRRRVPHTLLQMSALASFLSEVDGAPQAASSSSSSSSTSTSSGPQGGLGKLVIACCIDWDGMGGRAGVNEELAMDGPHVVEVPGCEQVREVYSSSTSHHMFILGEAGELFAWGQNTDGACGQGGGTIHWPLRISLPSSSMVVRKMATGRHHSLLLLTDGRLFATGSNASGQLGLGALAKGAKNVDKFTHVSSIELPCSDVSCGESHSMACTSLESGGQLYTWGHPLNGQLGTGTKGDFIKDGGKGAAVQFHFVPTPFAVNKYVNKDAHGKVIGELVGAQVRIRQVGGGKNHSMVLEDWENGGLGRLFSCGFGGYGRLGHNGVGDELLFREISFFSMTARDPATGVLSPVAPTNPQRKIVKIDAGNSLSVAVSVIGTAWNWGKLSNSKSGESIVYPKLCDAGGGLIADPRLLANGSNLVVVGFGPDIVAWGVPVAGKLGLDGDVRSSVVPKYVSALEGIPVHAVCAGHGHVGFVCCPTKAQKLPEYKKPGGADDASKAKKQKTK